MTAIDKGERDKDGRKKATQEPLALTEYTCRLATHSSVYVV